MRIQRVVGSTPAKLGQTERFWYHWLPPLLLFEVTGSRPSGGRWEHSQKRAVPSFPSAVAQLSFSFHPYFPFFPLTPPIFREPTCQGGGGKKLFKLYAGLTAKPNLCCNVYKRREQKDILVLVGRNSWITRNKSSTEQQDHYWHWRIRATLNKCQHTNAPQTLL